ncbi:TetR family transcriptional regulator [Actinosynnema pretiosum subsp. pretiosum]|uniref:Transcriptional regulator, TetR family n=2 Tax=Actinosynnema TaxID=40566 RepID=C6WBI4_ACTMD|nr:TetR/AcrR family transcriptional regulator [Actinosynnema mirum]ACU35552.1 transcriptional regulator, TetR family [Actinosynnema mirum DSM 43827]AXX28933.1 Transcriptional regulator, TetR family [Actinosynnema pretiosum subsp. pretiosum]QUF06779.1 TetR family transcriptional regulator [Actinosynnema pretiosum subsp. pretiosum]
MATVPERLITAATRLFAAKGYDRVAVQEVVEQAGVTKGAMYHYFGSKDDLLAEIYGRLLRMQTERLEHFAAAEGPVDERLRAAAVDVVVTSVDNFDQAKVYFRCADHLPEDKRLGLRAERRRYHERFRGLVEQGQAEGVFSPAAPADLVVNYFFGAVHHLAEWYSAEGALTAGQVGEHYADLLISSLRA